MPKYQAKKISKPSSKVIIVTEKNGLAELKRLPLNGKKLNRNPGDEIKIR
ncbi:hypothetical protein GTO10_03295, partial [Candidatus Saccharibacteria bacterium]|nr:hypothetical protein [Candidatus Saccharibacteria bacterium]